jgi:hypothetical protein
MLQDKFGAKDPRTRDTKTRSLAFDVEKIKNHLENYTKDKNPTEISSYQKVSDSSDSNDSSREDLFNEFFSFSSLSPIKNEIFNTNNLHENTLNRENIRQYNDETNTMGLNNSVITVITVTNKNISEKKTESNQENRYKKQVQNTTTAIEFIERDIASSSKHSNYRCTLEQIEKFFVSDNGQEEDHILEESICRDLIGQQNH